MDSPIEISVDATGVARRILRVRLRMPAKPGRQRFLYPKWIPGEHGPTGPGGDAVNLRFNIGGCPIAWRRDPVEMRAYEIEVPPGGGELEIAFDFLTPPQGGGFTAGPSATPFLGVICWNQLLLYPDGPRASDIRYTPSLKLPEGWRHGSALRALSDDIRFEQASLETLIDSPVLAGVHLRTYELAPGHYLHLASDNPKSAVLSETQEKGLRRLIAEAGALFGVRHYRDYHFLLTLSDQMSFFGLEHHESSDNRIAEDGLTDESQWRRFSGLLPHEYVHSWNGKYRRPAGLATAAYHQPMHGELLWVYEGLTEYLGFLLTARAGLQTAEDFRDGLAMDAGALAASPGRAWRPLADTAVAAQDSYASRGDWANLRRSVDFYTEGALVWLEADAVIRRESGGARSIDDFCRLFFAGEGGKAEVRPYELADVIAGLDAIQPYGWAEFFDTRVYQVMAGPPVAGIEAAGWRLEYRGEVPSLQKALEGSRKKADERHSIGLHMQDDGTVLDVIAGGEAHAAGVTPGVKILAVNGRKFSAKTLRAAIGEGGEALDLLVEEGDFYRSHTVANTRGRRYPVLRRDESKADLLAEIIRPLSP